MSDHSHTAWLIWRRCRRVASDGRDDYIDILDRSDAFHFAHKAPSVLGRFEKCEIILSVARVRTPILAALARFIQRYVDTATAGVMEHDGVSVELFENVDVKRFEYIRVADRTELERYSRRVIVVEQQVRHCY